MQIVNTDQHMSNWEKWKIYALPHICFEYLYFNNAPWLKKLQTFACCTTSQIAQQQPTY